MQGWTVMAVTNPPERKLNRKERRANLAKVHRTMRKFSRKRGPSVAPPEPTEADK